MDVKEIRSLTYVDAVKKELTDDIKRIEGMQKVWMAEIVDNPNSTATLTSLIWCANTIGNTKMMLEKLEWIGHVKTFTDEEIDEMYGERVIEKENKRVKSGHLGVKMPEGIKKNQEILKKELNSIK